MGRALAVALAALVVVIVLGYVGAGLRCGMEETPATPRGEPPEGASCVPYVHPLAAVFLALGAAAVVGAVRARPLVPLSTGVAMGALGSLFVFSLGFLGVGLALLLVASGATLPSPRRGLVAGTAAGAVVVSFLFIVLFANVDGRGLWDLPFEAAWLLASLPALGWLVLAWRATRGTT